MPSINLKRLPTIGQCGHSDRPDCRLPQTSNDDCCPISTTTTTTTTTNQRSPILISTTSDHRNQSPSSTSITSSLNSSFFSSIITPSSSSSQSSLLFGRRTSLATVYGLLSLSLSLNVVLSQDGHRQTTFTSTGWNESGNNIVHHHQQQQQKQSTLSVDTGQTHYVTQSVLPKAENLSVILTSWYPPAVRVHWRYNFSQIQNSRLKAFQIMYYPSKSRYRIIQEVPHYFTNLTLDRLQPGVEYNLTVNAMSESGTTNDSRVVQFISPDNETRRGHKKFFNRPIHVYPDEIQEGLQVREDEVVIVVLVIIAWIGCLFVFFNKWGKIRMLEPYQPQYKESFHNSIHSIHPKPSRMNTCTSVPPNMISIESRGSLIPDRDLFLHHSRMTESGQLYQCASGTTYHHPAYRPRLNSVFVGNPYHRDSLYPEQNMPRKVKSAEDLKSLVVQVSQNIPSTSTSVL